MKTITTLQDTIVADIRQFHKSPGGSKFGRFHQRIKGLGQIFDNLAVHLPQVGYEWYVKEIISGELSRFGQNLILLRPIIFSNQFTLTSSFII